MPRAAVQSFRSSSLRYERGHSGSASFTARPRGARRRSRSASRRCAGGARSAGNRAPGVGAPAAPLGTVATLRSAHLEIQRRPPDSIERAALQMLRTIRKRQSALPMRGSGGTARHVWVETLRRGLRPIVAIALTYGW